MISAWRICRRVYAELSGEGARRYGGRWNSPGRPLVYLAEHPALAILEVRVHLDVPLELLPDDYVLMHVSLPDEPPADAGVVADTVADGDAWLTSKVSAVRRVPALLAPHSSNFLFNPAHPRAGEASVVEIEPYRFDPRLWGE
ncbi:MAG: RES family NAD+ phosphorylase [Acetobacteraceae bacterium]|nr:RES family NAD+ phosphorylase [Acetobacteraceae bacterium]